MPRRTDLNSVLVIGSGPIVIGQAAEFDYSGTQALRVLKEEGVRVILVNSNPATIMTDPEFADATYIEPITPEVIEKIIAKEKPDAILPTLGGQTALNAAIELGERGILEKYNVELIGANIDAINLGEDREAFKGVVERAGGESARSVIVHSMPEALEAAKELGYPMVVRPSFTMGGLGSGMAYNEEDLYRIAGAGIQYSPTSEVLLEESILGWKEYELEMMRDTNDNVVVVCSIENFDPVGVHTGDSITVAPALTLTDREFQKLRDIAINVIREVGVDTGGCNIQFAIDPKTGRVIVIEMNPRVSRSSALASKATGFPIAKIATKLSLGYTLDEIPNDITQKTPASFEPTLDYVVVKVPRFAFEKFPAADPTLTTTMKSVGEAMALGRNFTEALQKAMRSLEQKGASFSFKPLTLSEVELAELIEKTKVPTTQRIYQVQQALLAGATVEQLHEATKIDPWFLDQLVLLNEVAGVVYEKRDHLDPETLKLAKRHGFSDAQIAEIIGSSEDVVRGVRHALGIRPVFKTVDTCAAEFEAFTPYHYSSYDLEDEVAHHEKPSIMILGSGPNRIGQGIEFDYSCVHASMVLRSLGYETVMVNCNPETVSTDYDISTRLYFEPLTLEDVLEIVESERRTGGLMGVFVQLGGQTPLKLARALKDAGVPILGTTPEAIDLAEDRGEFSRVLEEGGLISPKNGTAFTFEGAKRIADEIGYPVLVRPSYVLGGRGMEIVYDEANLARYLENATEKIARGTGVRGLINIQFAYVSENLYVIEANPRASRTVPFVSKATGVQLAKAAVLIGLGKTIAELKAEGYLPQHMDGASLPQETAIAVKAAVLPFARFRTPEGVVVDSLLSPEMRSTGEVMGLDQHFDTAFAKAQAGAGSPMPTSGKVFISVANHDKRNVIIYAKMLESLGFEIVSTGGTAEILRRNGLNSILVASKFAEANGDHSIVDMVRNGDIDLILNTPAGGAARSDGYEIRAAAVSVGCPVMTTISEFAAAVQAITALREHSWDIMSLQEHDVKLAAAVDARLASEGGEA